MYKLSLEEVIYIHSEAVRRTGGSDGIRDMGLLESAVNAPFQSFGGYDVYPTIYEKAARLGFGLAQNHAFIDGNKRIAVLAMLMFLKGNNIEIDCTEFELFSVILKLASSEITFDDLVKWIKNHEVPRH
ncbi:MAG: type II toxin-antitoxin system death-on-curing family toxin [Synergistaceae bacterium]|nr:type II toxin-antitoxin system death-on-curing family toxin [Synergistaceae bacterium]